MGFKGWGWLLWWSWVTFKPFRYKKFNEWAQTANFSVLSRLRQELCAENPKKMHYWTVWWQASSWNFPVVWCGSELVLELGIGIGCEVGGVVVLQFPKMIPKFDLGTTPGALKADVYLCKNYVVNIWHGYNFLVISQEEPNQYQIPIRRWGIKINILAKLWANPIPNSNSRVPTSEEDLLHGHVCSVN